jgi:hypothetical protein
VVGQPGKTRKDVFQTGQPRRRHGVEGTLVQPLKFPEQGHGTVYPLSDPDHADDHILGTASDRTSMLGLCLQ